jgi:hypothetical protein
LRKESKIHERSLREETSSNKHIRTYVSPGLGQCVSCIAEEKQRKKKPKQISSSTSSTMFTQIFQLLCSDNPEKNTSTTSSSTSSTTASHARGLAVMHSRTNYWERSGARHQLAPECGSSYSRPTISSILTTRRSQQRSGARQ